ncbi:hypothetical protein BDA99DRAFT_542985 [Phascolomyces articulosus]|uniref:Kinesin motor domain-containing protein n=1 Tax=Phascolomyces articulosus TaxID=60185 RepID=A0AAD5JP95_9FUNG|nr:hypothetical protein BDA99DRAFT_542985 [Phascolomyces articulosus]
MATTTAVRVALRVRPLTQKEMMCNSAETISFIPKEPQIYIGNEHSFTYDYVFDTKSQQQHIYSSSVQPLVEKYVDGFNATILAYGQTGSGKTYSMGTAIDGNTDSNDHQGIVPRFIRDLYERLEAKKTKTSHYNYQVLVSFLELYNEDLVDLLNIQQKQQQRQRTHSGTSTTCDISIREDIHGNIYWSGVREESCSSPEELLSFLTKGSLCRTVGSTDMNSVSSRSHAIFSVILKQQVPEQENPSEKNGNTIDDDDDDDNNNIINNKENHDPMTITSSTKTLVSKFHFVDLAGSERLNRTKAEGVRAREGIAINSGLLALGNVISALGDESRRSTHVPYRDSKLTRLLQDSLGGNSQTLMMACVSPADTNFVETLSTLKYANRARNIKNRVSMNQEFAGSSVEVSQLRSQVAKLKMELNALRAHGVVSSSATAGMMSTGGFSNNSNEINALRQEINRLRARVQEASDELCQVSAERDSLLLERQLNDLPQGSSLESNNNMPRLLDQLMMMQPDNEEKNATTTTTSNNATAHTIPMIAHYQKTIKDLRNELQDTRERLAFVENTQAPMMHALAMTSQMTPTPSLSTSARSSRRRGVGSGSSNRRKRAVNGNTVGNNVTFRSSRASKVPNNNNSNKRRHVPTLFTTTTKAIKDEKATATTATTATDVSLPAPIPISPTDNQDIEQWLQETIGPFNFPSETSDIRTEVRDSISKARMEIEKGMKVLEGVRTKEQEEQQQKQPVQQPVQQQGHQECELMADNELIQTIQSKENEFIFADLENEEQDFLEDIQRISPPADWDNLSVENNSQELQKEDDYSSSRSTGGGGGGHSRLSSGAETGLTDDTEELAAICDANPHFARIIAQVQSDIHVKEELVTQLERCESEYMHMRRKFEHQLSKLGHEILSIKRERDDVMRRAAYNEQQQQRQRQQRRGSDAISQREKQQLMEMRHAYEIKIKSLFTQLSDLRRKYSQSSSAIQSSRNQNESMLRALRVNVESLKMERRRMIKRMKEEALRVKEKMTAHEREIQQLRRRQQRDVEAKRRLERENKKVQLMLQKRSDEAVLTNDKLVKLIQILKKAVREGGVLDEKQLARCADLLHIGSALVASSTGRFSRRSNPNGGHGNKRKSNAAMMIPVQVRAAKKKHLLDRALYQFIVGKQAMLEMQQLITKRNELSEKKKELSSEREQLFGKPGSTQMVQFDHAVQNYMDERIETMEAEVSYINARIHALHNDAAHAILQEDDDDDDNVSIVDMDKQQQVPATPRSVKHVTFADEVMGTHLDKNPEDEWLDMDALEERYSVPPNADPETSHDMALKVIRSLAHDEAEKVMEAMVNDVTTLRMDEHARHAHVQQLEKSIQDLQHTLIVMKDKAIQTAIESEKKIRRLEQGNTNSSRRSSLCGGGGGSVTDKEEEQQQALLYSGGDDDSAIDVRVEEHYQQYGTIFDQIYNEGVGHLGQQHQQQQYQGGVGNGSSPVYNTNLSQSPLGSPASGPSPTLRPMRPQSLVDRPPVASGARRDSMSSPEQFLHQLMQAGLMSSATGKAAVANAASIHQQTTSSPPTSPRTRPTETSRRSSVQSDTLSWSSHGSISPKIVPQHVAETPLLNRRRRRAFSLQQQIQQQPQQQPNGTSSSSAAAIAAIKSRRRFSLRELSLGAGNNLHENVMTHHIAHQPSPLQQQFVLPQHHHPHPQHESHNNDDDMYSYHSSSSTSTPPQSPSMIPMTSSFTKKQISPRMNPQYTRPPSVTGGNVFDRLSNSHTKASEAKRAATPLMF